MKDPFQQRPLPAFFAAVGFVLFCFLLIEGGEPQAAPSASRSVAANDATAAENRLPARTARAFRIRARESEHR